MGFQTSVNTYLATGFPGDLSIDGPRRIATYILRSASAANNVIGRAFTFVDGTDNVVKAGGEGDVFAGLLVLPNQYASPGTSGSPLSPTIVLPNELPASLAIMGYYYVYSSTAVNIGDGVAYADATGILAAAPGGTLPASHTLIENAYFDRVITAGAGYAIVRLTQ